MSAMSGTLGRPFRRLERISRGRAGLVLVGVWAFAEAIAFPIIPDAAIGLLVLVVPRRLPALFAALVAGALAGTAALFALTLAAPDAVASMLVALPGIPPAMLDQAAAAVASGDPLAVGFASPGIPLKVYTYAWATGPAALLPLMAGAVVNRVVRIGPGLAALAALGLLAPRFLRRHDRLATTVYVGSYVIAYPIYWTLVGA